MHSSPAPRRRAFTLIEIMIVVLIIGILLAIAIPNFVQARENSRAKSCVANLYEINSAKFQCIMDNKIAANDTTSKFYADGTTPNSAGNYQLVGGGNNTTTYIRQAPACPADGSYIPGTASVAPICTVSDKATPKDSGGSLAAGDPADYGYNTTTNVAGKWYHGLN